NAIGFADRSTKLSVQLLVQGGVFRSGLPLPLLGASLGCKLFDCLDRDLIFLVSEQHSAQHLVFVLLSSLYFHHLYCFYISRDYHVLFLVGLPHSAGDYTTTVM